MQWLQSQVKRDLAIPFQFVVEISNISSNSVKNKTSLPAFVIGQTLSKYEMIFSPKFESFSRY